MSIQYGLGRKRIGLEDIYSTSLTGIVMTDEGNDSSGGYYVSGYIGLNTYGCGVSPEEPIMIVNIKNDALVGWKKITFKTKGTFTSACWWLNESTYANNLLTYSAAAGDKIFKSVNCFELPQFTVQTSACDNASTNAFHGTYAVGSYREWYQTRRRNSLTTIAGPSVWLSCNAVGTGATITISDIYVSL